MGENLSYRNRYNAGDLVWHKEVCVVHRTRYDTEGAGGVPFLPEFMLYELIHDGGKVKGWVKEGDLRPPTWEEFKWYKDPQTGGWKIGKNRAWPLIVAVYIGFMFLGYSVGSLLAGGTAWFVPLGLLGAAIPTITYIGTRRNWKGLQM